MCVVPLQAPTLTMEGGRLKRSLQLRPGRDFETVPEPVWRALYHWYGANLSLPRPVSGDNTPTVLLIYISVTDAGCPVKNKGDTKTTTAQFTL